MHETNLFFGDCLTNVEVKTYSKSQEKEATSQTQADQAILATNKPLHRKVLFNLQTYKFYTIEIMSHA